MKTYYETTVTELGTSIADFMDAGMMILFNENAPAELRDFCVLHHGNMLNDVVQVGDVLRIGTSSYQVQFVGSEVQKNLKNLGHITLRFNGNEEGESLEGSLYVEKKALPKVQVGDKVTLSRP